MSHMYKVVLLRAVLLSAVFWWSFHVGLREWKDIAFWTEFSSSSVRTAQAYDHMEQLALSRQPVLDPFAKNLRLDARSAFSLYVDEQRRTSVLFSQDERAPFPIASVTKLMTALVVLQEYDLNKEIVLSASSVAEEGDMGQLKTGERFTARDLLYPLLIESSNDAATALAGIEGQDVFVSHMNKTAAALGMTDTVFVNPAGLDPDFPDTSINLSSAKDVATLTAFVLEKHPELFDILALSSHVLENEDHTNVRVLVNTNELLGNSAWPTRVLGGKTGWTPEAKGNLVLTLEAPHGRGYIISVVLGTDHRFDDMSKLVDWVFQSYRW